NLSFQYTCNANFYCTYSNFTPITTLINIKWMKSVAFSSESTGQTTENFGSLSIISNGSSSAQGADVAAGSFWSEDVVSSAGSMGINRNITITINQNSP
ncbi:MAG: hypothetical protein ACXV8U_04245, partial [Methylobacter sp.]